MKQYLSGLCVGSALTAFYIVVFTSTLSTQTKPAISPTPPTSEGCIIIDQHVAPQDFRARYFIDRQYGQVQWQIDNVGNYTLVVETVNCESK